MKESSLANTIRVRIFPENVRWVFQNAQPLVYSTQDGIVILVDFLGDWSVLTGTEK